jgi:hypothetical protein
MLCRTHTGYMEVRGAIASHLIGHHPMCSGAPQLSTTQQIQDRLATSSAADILINMHFRSGILFALFSGYFKSLWMLYSLRAAAVGKI